MILANKCKKYGALSRQKRRFKKNVFFKKNEKCRTGLKIGRHVVNFREDFEFLVKEFLGEPKNSLLHFVVGFVCQYVRTYVRRILLLSELVGYGAYAYPTKKPYPTLTTGLACLLRV